MSEFPQSAGGGSRAEVGPAHFFMERIKDWTERISSAGNAEAEELVEQAEDELSGLCPHINDIVGFQGRGMLVIEGGGYEPYMNDTYVLEGRGVSEGISFIESIQDGGWVWEPRLRVLITYDDIMEEKNGADVYYLMELDTVVQSIQQQSVQE